MPPTLQHIHQLRDEGLASISLRPVGFYPHEQTISAKNPELSNDTLPNDRCFENSMSTTVNGFLNMANSHNNRLDSQEDSYVLVTGGAGYIGSHTVLELLKDGYKVVVVDNFVNSCEESLVRIQKLAKQPLKFHHANVLDEQTLTAVFEKYKIWAVLHFAALKAVGESTKIPLDYYWNNVTGSLNLLRVMEKFRVHNIVFSSSATVYGDPEESPVNEQGNLGPVTNPYGKTKLFIEEVLRDMCKANKKWNSVILRYFNPTGAHPSGIIGENPKGIPNNLMPYVSQVVQGRLPYVNIYGGDYDTVDGTGVRDYIHVCDLATGHVAALRKLHSDPGCVAYNLGTGVGYSVLQIIGAMSRACGKEIPYKITDRRPGDVGIVTADASLANAELGWYPKYNLDQMCQDLNRWTSTNPSGYPTPASETKRILQEMSS
ncbi:269_t:CDS:2 [Paraglomus brasilianum]|uniref:269_t:CDS:1 n=1 Tax=Paraglomus brasilianum TaxID=144538 RepID=A0A9N9BXG4_9GLOM|nr:269_t:CDS:2 [Paraglomus brasilianum]